MSAHTTINIAPITIHKLSAGAIITALLAADVGHMITLSTPLFADNHHTLISGTIKMESVGIRMYIIQLLNAHGVAYLVE